MFKAKWITVTERQDNLHIRFEKRFVCDKPQSATMNITADDYYKLYINGSFVGMGPAPSYYFRYRYNTYDITRFLAEGENRIEVHCYYQGLTNRVWVSGDGIFGMIAEIYADNRLLVATDGSWEYSVDRTFTGGDTVGYATAYLENRNFCNGRTPLKKAVEIPCPHQFDSAPFPSLTVYPVKADPVIDGNRRFYDFRQEYVGTLFIEAVAKENGAKLVLHCAEELDANGKPRFDERCGCRYAETCVLQKGENRIEQYDYKALRYLEIIPDDEVNIADVSLLVRHFPFPETAQQIHTDDERLKAVFNLCWNTVKYGAQETLIDCPSREKGQYLGDVLISGFAHYYLTKDVRLLQKALFDYADSVRYSGTFLSVAPCAYRQKIADYDLLYPYMLLKYDTLTGDRETLKALSPVCLHILEEYAAYANADGLLENVTNAWNLVDWPENMRDGYEFCTERDQKYGLHSVINAYYINAVSSVEQIHARLHTPYPKTSPSLKRAFNRTFFSAETGLYVDCRNSRHASLHANILPIVFGICKEENVPKTVQYLLQKGMACSVYMSYFYLKALCVSHHEDAALQAITSDAAHSWQNMLREGATTAFEAWSKTEKQNASLFHPWAVSPILILNEYFSEQFFSDK